jgi:hypothetical protein
MLNQRLLKQTVGKPFVPSDIAFIRGKRRKALGLISTSFRWNQTIQTLRHAANLAVEVSEGLCKRLPDASRISTNTVQ